MTLVSRRALVIGASSLLAGCTPQGAPPPGTAWNAGANAGAALDPRYAAMYGPINNEPFPVEAIDLSQVQPEFLRQEVAYDTSERPGTIVVDPNKRFLYLVEGNGRALRYGVGVGKTEAFNFRGEAIIGRKAEWPRWTPTPDMIAREPERYGPYRGGMAGGVGNPLGARALYLYRNGRDTDYRLHGTIEPWTIGTKVSSGCIRLMNQDIIDLYRRVPLGTKVIVLPATGAFWSEAEPPPDNGPAPDGAPPNTVSAAARPDAGGQPANYGAPPWQEGPYGDDGPYGPYGPRYY